MRTLLTPRPAEREKSLDPDQKEVSELIAA
jgi:hypothetical protein